MNKSVILMVIVAVANTGIRNCWRRICSIPHAGTHSVLVSWVVVAHGNGSGSANGIAGEGILHDYLIAAYAAEA